VPKTGTSVITSDEAIEEDGQIEPDKSTAAIRKEPYALPKGFEWVVLEINAEQDVLEAH
jgi:hypothetical protein